ncbi:MAG: T9SS type A sorting domain-containing protein, partial [Schleiferiaceae bacterium]|nr:T9SS type A sorting domain-containing protein [Schleiferiaceae bacterium]
NMYSQDVIVTYSDEPSIGMLNVNGQNFAITGSPQTVALSNLVADGLPVNVTAHFTAIPSCNIAENALFTAPSACPLVGGTSCPSPFVVNVIPQGMNTNTWGNAVSDPYSFYFGLTQWKKLKSSVTGGVGPFSYSWGTINSGQIKPMGNKIDQKYLFQPISDCKVYLNVTDQSTNCTYGDTIDITWNDDYFCGTIGPNTITYGVEICENGLTSCVSWKTAITKLKAKTATLGECPQPAAKTNMTARKPSINLYPNPTDGTVFISMYSDSKSDAQIIVMDLNGQVVTQKRITVNSGENQYILDLEGKSVGLYLVHIKTPIEIFTEKLSLLH